MMIAITMLRWTIFGRVWVVLEVVGCGRSIDLGWEGKKKLEDGQ